MDRELLPGPKTIRQAVPISTEEAVSEDIAQVNCKDSERLASVKRLFEKTGASPENIAVEKQGGAENVYLRLKGQGQERL